MHPPGLTESDATRLLAQHGYNEIPSAEHASVFRIILRVLQEPMLALLLACGAIYVFTGEATDGILLFGSAVVVILITLFQEIKSERAVEALRDLSSPRALVIRDGQPRRIPARELVPGDLIQVSEGDRIPADAKLLSATHLAVDESMLTGESFSVTKDAQSTTQCQLYFGTLAVSGQGLAVVTTTGLKTEIGKIGKSLKAAPENQTPLQLELSRLVRVFGLMGILTSVLIALIYGLTRGDWPKGLLAGIAAAMALLPEEFPVVMTVFLAMGAWRISRKNVLTRRVAAIEALGSISTLCVDKTGTLTQNRMQVQKVVSQDPQTLLKIAALACHENPFDPMERAILTRSPIDATSGTRQSLYTLTPALMAMTCVWKTSENAPRVVASKGAPEAILKLCRLETPEQEKILGEVRSLASQGLRVLAVAEAHYTGDVLPEKQTEFQFEYRGLIAFEDPIRPDVPAAVQECQAAGIRVIMLTGDHPETAKSIASQLNLQGLIFTGNDVAQADDLQLQQWVRQASVFARVTPDQKLRIVTALKTIGERVAMTGDGVNDAPSLKWADIGVAMGGRGTDVARESAKIVLLDDNFSSLVAAIRLGRRIYDNLQKAIYFILSIHIPIAGLAILPVILKMPLLLLPAHIVFLELIIDPACTLVFEAEPESPGTMKKPPRSAEVTLMNLRSYLTTLTQGAIVLLIVFGVFYWQLQSGQSENKARTLAFFTLILSNLGLILLHRAQRESLIRTLFTKNLAFMGVSVGALILFALVLNFQTTQNLFSFSAIGAPEIGLAFASSVAALLLAKLVRPLSQ